MLRIDSCALKECSTMHDVFFLTKKNDMEIFVSIRKVHGNIGHKLVDNISING